VWHPPGVTRHRIRLALSFATPLVVLSLAACTAPDPSGAASDADVSSESPSETAAPTPTPAEPSTGSAALTKPEARRLAPSLVEARTGSFRSVTQLSGGRIERTGQYDLERLAHTLRADFEIGNEAFAVDAVIVGNDFYFKFTEAGAKASRCWSAFNYGDLGDQIADSGFLVPTEGALGIPPELATLAFVSVDSDGQVTSDLYTTASVIGSRFVTALAIDPDADNLAPIDLTDNGDGSLSWSTNLSALLDAVVASGAEPDPAIGMLFGTESSIAAEITGVGGSVTVQAPPDRLVVRPTGDDAADQRAFEQCNRA
jgi:hypothetical protein